MRQSAGRIDPLEIPLSLPGPSAADANKPGYGSYFVITPRSAANINEPRRNRKGEPVTGGIRVASLVGYFGKLFEAWLYYGRPEFNGFYEPNVEAFYSRLCSEGADIIFVQQDVKEIIPRLRLDPAFAQTPIVLVDTQDWKAGYLSREEHMKLGADAVLYVEVTVNSFLGVLSEFFPDSPSEVSGRNEG